MAFLFTGWHVLHAGRCFFLISVNIPFFCADRLLQGSTKLTENMLTNHYGTKLVLLLLLFGLQVTT